MAPVVRRSWAPRGHTPILYQQTRSWDKVSVIGALSVSPRRRRVGCYVALHPNANVTSERVVTFLKDLKRHLRSPIVLVWDRLPVHRSRRIARFLAANRRMHIELLPPYAPELNPVEAVWSYIKCNPLANFAPTGVGPLARKARRAIRGLRRRPDLLRSFIRSSPLPLRI